MAASYEVKWQPVVLVTNRRVECKCGALAVFVTGSVPEEEDAPYNVLDEVDVWCQGCFKKAQEEDE